MAGWLEAGCEAGERGGLGLFLVGIVEGFFMHGMVDGWKAFLFFLVVDVVVVFPPWEKRPTNSLSFSVSVNDFVSPSNSKVYNFAEIRQRP